MVLSCLLEPLRAARDITRHPVTWTICTPNDQPVRSSSGLLISPDTSTHKTPRSDLLIVVASTGYRSHVTAPTMRVLHHLATRADRVIAADSAAWLLAHAGWLAGRRATIHWQEQADFAEAFPNIDVTADQFVEGARFITCGGASTALDLMLTLIAARFGAAVAFDVSTMFVYDTARRIPASARAPGRLVGKGSASVLQALSKMIATIDAPVPLAQIAKAAGVSSRNLSRVFLAQVQMPPGQYYLSLRLSRARELSAITRLSQREIALKCGFSGPAALGKAFTKHFGHSLGKARPRLRG
jgi:transcriptional regulator GlxA family with amidase domain